MRTLVIGGMQFMGRRIVEKLLERGHDVTVLHRRATHELGPRVGNLQADRADLPLVARVIGQGRFDAVFDLAYDWQHGTPASQVEAAARSCGPQLQRYVFMSSVAAYPPGVDHREEDPLAPDDFPNPYVQHKASAERALFRMHAESGSPVVTFRPPFVHGPGQPFYREAFFWDRLLDGRLIILPDGGESPMPWAFVDDVAEACVRATEVPDAAGQAFNVGHVEKTTQRTFVEALARVAGVEPAFVSVPRARIHAAGGQLMGPQLYFGEYLDLPPLSSIIEKAPRVLGVTPTPLEEALGKSYAWYRTQPRRAVDYAFEDRLLAGA
ncbi:MAG: NAD-dependent epimerase/dehydratase family protein [Acidobacteria bacterium]|nr:NAD-dependent epimerase/dehydratase family protein [Acidobacteriota bacterium]